MISCFSGDETMCAAASLHLRCIQMLFLNAVAWKFGIQSNISFEGGKEGENTAQWIHLHVCASCFRSHYSDGFMCRMQESSEIHSRLDQLSSTPVFNAYSFSIPLIISFTTQSNFCGEKYSYYTVTQISAIPERKRLRCLKCWSSSPQVYQLSWQIPA